MKTASETYIDMGNQHLLVYSFSLNNGLFVHYAREQILFNALECYLKGFCLYKDIKAAKKLIKRHDIIGLINVIKNYDPSLLTWLEDLPNYKEIEFDYTKERAGEITKLPNFQELEAKYQKIYTEPEFYMLLKLGPNLKYGALDKNMNLRNRIFYSGSNTRTVNIIREIRSKLELNGKENCLLEHNLKSGNLPEQSKSYIKKYLE